MRSTARAATAALITVALATLLPAAHAAADAQWVSFDASASARGLHLAAIVPGGVLSDEILDAGLPFADATVDSLGGSRARAAAPFPGDLALTVPGIASGVAGVTLPDYPLIATSSHPTQGESESSAGTFTLNASSSRSASDALAVSGEAGAGATRTSASVAHRSDQSIKAVSESASRSLTFGSLVVGSVVSRAQAVRSVDGVLVTDATFEVAAIHFGSTEVPLPLQDTGPVRDALSAHGIDVRILDAERTPGGVVSPALEVRVTVPASLTGSGSSTLIWTIGRSAASIAGTSETVEPDEPGSHPEPSRRPMTRRTVVLGPAPVPVPAARPAPVHQPRPAPVPRPVPVAVETWPSAIYALAALPAAIAFGAILVVRRWGVRRTWH